MREIKRILIIKNTFWYNRKNIIYYLKKKSLKGIDFLKNTKEALSFLNIIIYTNNKVYNNFWYLQNNLREFKQFCWEICAFYRFVFVENKKYFFLKKNIFYITLCYLTINYFYRVDIIKKKNFKYSYLIKKGKRLIIFFIWYNLLCLIKNKLKIDIFFFLQLIFIKIIPLIFFRTRYASGRKYKIPYMISKCKACRLALQWFFLNVHLRNETTLLLRLFGELIDSYRYKSKTIKHKHFVYKTIKENRVFIYLFKKKKKWN